MRHVPFGKPQDDSVSERTPATFRGTSFTGPRSPTVIPVSPSSDVPSLAAVNAPTRGRLSTASQATGTSRSSRQSFSSHLSDAEPSSSSRASSSPGARRRGSSSRRTKLVAVLNEDKTFSLVPQRPRNPDAPPPPSSQSSNPPRSESALSEYGPGLKSSQLHSFPTTPRVSQASSHEGVSSYASSHYDRPSSSLAGTLPDRSITPATPVPSSPASSYQETITEDPAVEPSASSWIGRMVGGLRRVPNLPDSDSKGKKPAHPSTSDTTETPLPAAPEVDTPSHDPDLEAPFTEQPEAPIRSRTPSTGSDNTNYKVYRHASEAVQDPGPEAHEAQGEDQGSGESLVDPHLRPQPSFATAQTVSTDFESTNYRIYGHSDDEGSDEAHAESPIEGPTARALRNPFGPPLQPQDSIGSLQSAESSASENTNYRVYGPGSPDLSPVPESPAPAQADRELRPAQSFVSAVSSVPESANYVVYGNSPGPSSVESLNHPQSSGPDAPPPRSPPLAVPSLYTQIEEDEAGPSGTAPTEPNYVVIGDPSPEPSREASPTETEGTVVRHPREEFSQESLVVSPLRPHRPSEEGFGYFTARSRTKAQDDLQTKKSLKSVKSSISSIINEETTGDFFTGQAYLDAPADEYETSSPSVAGPSERQRQLDEQRERERLQREAAEGEGAGAAPDSEGPMALPTTPHQWSSQLSTVQSETEPSSSSPSENRGSVGSLSFHGSHERRSSRAWSSHSRQMLSISSSLAAELEGASRSRSGSQPGSLDRPGPSCRPGHQGMVRDYDEHGDGLGDLQQISPRPSRSRLSDMFSNNNSSERSLHSSASNRSFSNNIPLWARVYYGSGERRFLRSTSISSVSDLSSRPGSMAQHSASPTSDQFPVNLHSPRRRAKEQGPGGGIQRHSTTGSMDIRPEPANDEPLELGFRRSMRRMTSSLWSPHLRRDVRARYSIWDTPSVAWSAESGMFGRRNLQVVLFVVGFIFPLAWMTGALLPLPKPSPLSMVQRDSSYSDLAVRTQSHELERHIETVDELRYENARWWRMLNRCMSVVGLLIIGAVIGLAVAAVKQGWGTRS